MWQRGRAVKISDSLVNIHGNTGLGNERWPVVTFTVAPLILPYKIVCGPASAWSKIFHGPVEISFQTKSQFRSVDLLWSCIFYMKKTGKTKNSPWPRTGVLQNNFWPRWKLHWNKLWLCRANPKNNQWPCSAKGPKWQVVPLQIYRSHCPKNVDRSLRMGQYLCEYRNEKWAVASC